MTHQMAVSAAVCAAMITTAATALTITWLRYRPRRSRVTKAPCGCLRFACGAKSACDLHDPAQTAQVVDQWRRDEMNR